MLLLLCGERDGWHEHGSDVALHRDVELYFGFASNRRWAQSMKIRSGMDM
jgi:hypothetical protein